MKKELTGNFVDDCFDISREMAEVGRELRRVSTAFAIVGQYQTSEILEELQIQVFDLAELVKKVCQNKTNKDLNEMRELNKEFIDKLIP